MSKEAAEFEALVTQISQLEEILLRRPDNPQVKKRLAECTVDYERRKERLAGSLAEKETPPAEKKASTPQKPAPSGLSSVAPLTKREQLLLTAQRQCVQAERAAQEARVRLDGLIGQRSLLLRGNPRGQPSLDRSIDNATRDIKARDGFVLAARARAAKMENSVREAKAKAQQRIGPQGRQLAEQPSTIDHMQVDEPGHEGEPTEVVESVQQLEAITPGDEPAHPVDQPSHQVDKSNQHVDKTALQDAFTPITAEKPAPVIPKPANKTGLTFPEDLEEKDLVDLEGEDVSFPIAALVAGMFMEGVRTIGVMPDNLQLMSRSGSTNGVACLTKPDKMIIPLMLEIGEHVEDCGTESYNGDVVEAVQKAHVQLTPEEIERRKETGEWTGATGHWLLVIATRSRTGGIIDLTFLNSVSYSPGPGYDASKNVLRRIVRNIVRYSGWMGTTIPSWGQEVFRIPQFQHMGNTCGTHVVVNAWAHILGLELNEMADWAEDESLYREARFLMIRAAAGDVSAQHIEAWLVGSQKVWERKHEPAVGSELAAILKAQTVAMKGDILSEFIENANIEAAATPSADISTDNVSKTPTTKPAPKPTPKPAPKPAPKYATRAATKASTAAKTSLPKASGQPELRRSGRTRQTVSKAPGFVRSLEIPRTEVYVLVPAKRKAADLDSKSFDDSDIESSRKYWSSLKLQHRLFY
ncbi:MAG: hypothetical protein Q9172_007121 [Xanthocarpia lactea]